MTKYVECDECRMKPGSPVLCGDCLERRTTFYRTGECRPPRVCSVEAQERARKWDELMRDCKKLACSFGPITLVESPRPE